MRNSVKYTRLFVFKAGILSLTAIALALLLIFSCNNLLVLGGGGTLVVSVPGGRSANDATVYTIELNGTSGSIYSKTIPAGQTATFETLVPDTYTILVKGSNAEHAVVYYGSSSATVEAGKTVAAMVELMELLGRLTVEFSGEAASNSTNFIVELRGAGSLYTKTVPVGETAQFERLVPDIYIISVRGTNANNEVLCCGNNSASVEVGKPTTATVELKSTFGSLQVDFAGDDSDSVVKYIVKLSGSNEFEKTEEVTDRSVQLNDLVPDTYNIVVNGINENGVEVLHGSSSVMVVAGNPTSATVELKSTFGSLQVDFAGDDSDSVVNYIVKLSGSNEFEKIEEVTDRSVQLNDLVPDTYNIVVNGINENGVEVLHGSSSVMVVAGNPTTATVELLKVVSDFAGLQAAVTAGGTVYVAKDITVTGNLTISNDVEIRALDKDVTLNLASDVLMFEVGSGGELTLGGGEYMLTVDGNKKNQSFSLLNIIDGGKVHLYGTITNSYSPKKTGIEIGESSSFYMYDGATVSNCECTASWGRGGAIAVRKGGEMYMYGGTITGNRCYCAAAIYVEGGTFNMYGGTITGNTATSTSGASTDQPAAVEINSSGKFIQTGGSITGNSPSNIVNKSTLQ